MENARITNVLLLIPNHPYGPFVSYVAVLVFEKCILFSLCFFRDHSSFYPYDSTWRNKLSTVFTRWWFVILLFVGSSTR